MNLSQIRTTMKPTRPAACFFLKSAWQAVSLRSALTALLLFPLAALHAADVPLPSAKAVPMTSDATAGKQPTQLGNAVAGFDFSAGLPAGWRAKGSAFGKGDAVKYYWDHQSYYAVASSAGGVIISPERTVSEPWINIQVAGEKLVGELSLVRVLPDGLQVVRTSPSSTRQISGWLKDGWFSMNVKDYVGEKVYFQLSDCPSLEKINLKQICFEKEPRGDFSGRAFIEATKQLLEESRAIAVADPFRPVLHAQALSGKSWDANGLVFANGLYHYFYLQKPYRGENNMGLMTSADLVNWEHRPVAVWPSVEDGEHAVWSGSAVLDDDGRCHIFYTAIGANRSPVFSPRQAHCVSTDASFDRFEKVSTSMITMNDIPVPAQHVRDPFVFREGDVWYMALTGSVLKKGNESFAGAKTPWPKDVTQGAVFLFRSENLYDWTYVGIPLRSEDKPLWEVADFIKTGDGLWFFSPGGKEYHVGKFDLETAAFTPTRTRGTASLGQLYAYRSISTTAPDPKGRNLIMTRLAGGGSWERRWVDTYAFPREWSFKGNTLIQKPVPELQSLRREHFNYRGSVTNEAVVIDAAATEYELIVEMDLGTAAKCGLEIRRSDDGAQGYRITWDGSKAYAQSIVPEGKDPWWKQAVHIVPENKSDPKRITFHVFVDRGLVELFVDYQKTFERSVENMPLDCKNIAVFAEGGKANVISYDRWNLAR